MADDRLLKKLKLKPGLRAAVINAPADYLASLHPVPEGLSLDERLDGVYDWIQLFAQNQAELAAQAPAVVRALNATGLLWVAFPKGSSKLQTDLTRDRGWDSLQGADLKWINLISVDPTWSAFSLRPYKPGEDRQSFR